jgi:hypothetical protein
MTSIYFFHARLIAQRCSSIWQQQKILNKIFSLFFANHFFHFRSMLLFFFTFFLILEPSIFAFLLSLSDNGWLWEVTGQVWTCTTTSTYFIDFTVFPFFVCVLEKGELDGLSNIINLCSSLLIKYTLWVELKNIFSRLFIDKYKLLHHL